MNGMCICVCVCETDRRTECEYECEVQLAIAGQGFLPFLDSEYITVRHILQKRYTKQMSVLKPFVLNSGIVFV